MTWQLRRAGLADVPAIMAIENAMFPSDAWSTDAMARDVADPHCYYLVAFPPDAPEQIEAYAGLLAPRGAPEADIQTIAVSTAAQGRGLGRVLMLRLIDEARARGAREVFLEVRADNPGAIHLYTSLGFAELGVRRGYYKPDNVDAIVMRLNIPAPQAALAEPSPNTTTPLETNS
ncbi:ribosomal protein S18-alanine N-acetyltransferase [Microterricola pindariensis]|uniref:Ribosomal-protein-alanine N-acetyltransferase n=1 Tax=Microterricola pindariensis TaxID=478010 RepID=A0ABX5AZN4_9MICO|nr:ribosomal protein S18-alanine N-acetyltransferase [Microterricola pindariensis]PPL20000.1 ribosomal-protein-alanine N-acetyltransferase [Microterricola pindariensis]